MSGLVVAALKFFDSKSPGQFFEQEAFCGAVGLEPLSINHHLRDGPLPSPPDDFFGRSWSGFDVDLRVREVVLG